MNVDHLVGGDVLAIQCDGAEVVRISSNRWGQNCYLLFDAAGSCAVIDPGYDKEIIFREIRDRSLRVEVIFATHTHFDHIASVVPLQNEFGNPPFFCHLAERKLLNTANIYTFALMIDKIAIPEPIKNLDDGETLQFSCGLFKVYHLPGHTPGGCVFQYRNLLFVGDLLIRSQGKLHKLPGFDRAALECSRRKLFELFSDDTRVFPGHGPVTTMASERLRLFSQHQGEGAC